ncbi:MAG: glycosyltransferase [Planctomycetota bacterium]|jgi:UDP-N-acetylglucosamine transferase subunit ALG13
MIFLTVGTQFPFDRLVRAVDEAAGRNGFDEQIFAQVGTGSYRPKNFEAVPSLAKEIFDERLYEADSIISHAGIGTITMALEHNKPLLVMPRLARYDDVVNDHQLALAEKFEQLGHLLLARYPEEVAEKLEELKSFVPAARKAQPEAAAGRISDFLSELCESRARAK